MNPFEQQMQLGRDLMELNAQWFSKIAEFDGVQVKSYVKMNQEFMQRLPEAKDPQSFLELQREYAETLWKETQETMRTRGELMKDAMEASGELVKNSMSIDQPEAKKTKAKAA
jgi:hypothetical protein